MIYCQGDLDYGTQGEFITDKENCGLDIDFHIH